MRKLRLLKNRREALNLKSEFELVPTNFLLVKGYYLGGIILTSFVLVFLMIFLYNQRLINVKNNLKPFSDKFDYIQRLLIKNNTLINKTNDINKKIINAISGIRSGSGIFIEISKITPRVIELNKIEVGRNGIKLFGISPQKYGLKVLNSFELSISKSPFFDNESIQILKAEKFTRSDYSKIKQKDIKNNYLKFEILASFNKENNDVNSGYLSELGSYGLSERINLIKEIEEIK